MPFLKSGLLILRNFLNVHNSRGIMKIWIQAARPKTLIASVSPVLIGTILARNAEGFNLWIFLFTLLTAMGVQIVTNFANDYFDFKKGADTKHRVGPVRVTQAGLVTPKQMKKALLTATLLTFLVGVYLIYQGGALIALLLLLSLFLAIMYTKGRYALAYLGLGEIFVFFFFGPIATGATYYLQTQAISTPALLAGIAPGALSTCILLVNNIRDEKEDQAAHKKTLVVRFGKKFGKGLYVFLILVGTLSPLLLTGGHPYVIAAAFTLIPAVVLMVKLFRVKTPSHYNPLLGATAQLLLLYTLIFCSMWTLG